MSRLNRKFYLNPDVVLLARELLGKIIVTNFNGERTSGIICETEAYQGIVDRASHAYGGRRTTRTETMYAKGGISYVYLCYGIHYLFNVVTHETDTPHAILIRGIIPLEGEEIMKLRKPGKWNSRSGIGPGNVSKCLGIDIRSNAVDLTKSPVIFIEDRNIQVPENEVLVTPRIGVDYAGDDAALEYRFAWNKNDLYKSSKKN